MIHYRFSRELKVPDRETANGKIAETDNTAPDAKLQSSNEASSEVSQVPGENDATEKPLSAYEEKDIWDGYRYRCPLCTEKKLTYGAKVKLKTHLERHHPKQWAAALYKLFPKKSTMEGKLVKCPFVGCESGFTQRSTMNRHIKRSHRGQFVVDTTYAKRGRYLPYDESMLDANAVLQWEWSDESKKNE